MTIITFYNDVFPAADDGFEFFDRDTIACMTGGIAATFYEVSDSIIEQVMRYLPDDMMAGIIRKFEAGS